MRRADKLSAKDRQAIEYLRHNTRDPWQSYLIAVLDSVAPRDMIAHPRPIPLELALRVLTEEK